MSRIMKWMMIGCLALVTFAPAASARGVVVIGGGYGWYGPGWYGPGWYGPSYAYGRYGMPNAGNVKIKTEMKDASVFVDGGFAGPAGKLKKFPLRAGTHDIALRDAGGHTIYQERIDVIPGKTIEIHPDYSRH